MTTSQSLQVRTNDGVKFGKELREKEFSFGEGFRNLNHGEYDIAVSGAVGCSDVFLNHFQFLSAMSYISAVIIVLSGRKDFDLSLYHLQSSLQAPF
jgi:hypothetical protein